jgi:hypothetical protein
VELEALWLALQSKGVAKTKYLEVAVRRFSYKGERTRPEDQAVDLVIAAEALFLTEGRLKRERNRAIGSRCGRRISSTRLAGHGDNSLSSCGLPIAFGTLSFTVEVLPRLHCLTARRLIWALSTQCSRTHYA